MCARQPYIHIPFAQQEKKVCLLQWNMWCTIFSQFFFPFENEWLRFEHVIYIILGGRPAEVPSVGIFILRWLYVYMVYVRAWLWAVWGRYVAFYIWLAGKASILGIGCESRAVHKKITIRSLINEPRIFFWLREWVVFESDYVINYFQNWSPSRLI